MKKLRKNKFLVLVICVTIVSLVYFGAQKAIDSYIFNTNSDIVTESESFNGDDEGTVAVENAGGNADRITEEGSGEISDDEIDLVLEEVEGEVQEGEVSEDVDNSDGEGEDDNRDGTDLEENKIYVYITGEVNNPGVLILNEGSRIVDAINAAGGTTVKANVSKVNLVYVLDDGMKVNIPNNTDLKNNPDFEYITMNSGDGGRDDYLSGIADSSSSGDSSGENSSSSGSGSSKKYSIVNINTATQTELETLPGIGPSLALKIINYRKENGKFSSIEEIKNVSGIGESKFENLKKYIKV